MRGAFGAFRWPTERAADGTSCMRERGRARGERAASARILLSVFVSDKQVDTGFRERAVGTRSEVEVDVLVAAEFAMENAVELDARLVLVLDNQKELSVVLDGSWSRKQAEEDDVVGFYVESDQVYL